MDPATITMLVTIVGVTGITSFLWKIATGVSRLAEGFEWLKESHSDQKNDIRDLDVRVRELENE